MSRGPHPQNPSTVSPTDLCSAQHSHSTHLPSCATHAAPTLLVDYLLASVLLVPLVPAPRAILSPVILAYRGSSRPATRRRVPRRYHPSTETLPFRCPRRARSSAPFAVVKTAMAALRAREARRTIAPSVPPASTRAKAANPKLQGATTVKTARALPARLPETRAWQLATASAAQ